MLWAALVTGKCFLPLEITKYIIIAISRSHDHCSYFKVSVCKIHNIGFVTCFKLQNKTHNVWMLLLLLHDWQGKHACSNSLNKRWWCTNNGFVKYLSEVRTYDWGSGDLGNRRKYIWNWKRDDLGAGEMPQHWLLFQRTQVQVPA